MPNKVGTNRDQTHVSSANEVLPGLHSLWAETLADPEICIAILDGPVDLGHPSLQRANLRQWNGFTTDHARGPAAQHGTHVASIIFGQHDGPVPGLAPRCRGVSIPIFSVTDGGCVQPCS